MSSEKSGITAHEMRSRPVCGAADAAAKADISPAASMWDRFGTWPPALRLAIAVLLSLMLWVPVWFGARAALRTLG